MLPIITFISLYDEHMIHLIIDFKSLTNYVKIHTMSEYIDVSVIIPFKDHADLTAKAVKTFVAFGPKIREFLLISNNSSSAEIEKLHAQITTFDNAKILKYNHPFNYQKINNWAIKQASSQFILMMNNDIEFCQQSIGLIEKMYQKAGAANVGIVGATLLYGDHKHIQHAGVFLYPEGMADHLYITKSYADALANVGDNDFPYDIRENHKMTAVTGAFQLVEKKKFDEVSGMNEKFIITGGDVDLCIRLNKAGYQTWFVGGGFAIHKESMSRRQIPLSYNDFYQSYLSYITAYDPKVGDPFLPKVTKNIKVWGK